jgi:SAM-dependent methyltransferase
VSSISSPTLYKRADRGERLKPRRRDPMFQVLTALGETLGRVVGDLPAGETVVDFGCGDRPYEPLLRRRFARYIGADLPGNLRADLSLSPDGELPLEDTSVDCVLSSQVLEHVTDPAAYLAEAHRVLRPGCHIIVSTHGMWQYHPDPGDYWRWTHAGLRLQLEAAGFEVVRIESVLARVSTALQLLQAALIVKLSRLPRRLCVAFFQTLIGLTERSRGSFSEDASVYVVVGRVREAV